MSVRAGHADHTGGGKPDRNGRRDVIGVGCRWRTRPAQAVAGSAAAVR
ncbi:hypothetical protein ABZW11_34020 [Nonomuraea sp. NPDC004580]